MEAFRSWKEREENTYSMYVQDQRPYQPRLMKGVFHTHKARDLCGCIGLITGVINRYYSKTSNNRPSEKRTNSIQRTELMRPIDFPIDTVHLNLQERTPPNTGQIQWTLSAPGLAPKADNEATPTNI